jgi:hypothetical protein
MEADRLSQLVLVHERAPISAPTIAPDLLLTQQPIQRRQSNVVLLGGVLDREEARHNRPIVPFAYIVALTSLP